MLIQQPIPIGVTAATGSPIVIPAPVASLSDITPKRLRIISGVLTAAVAGTVQFKSTTAGIVSGAMTLAVGQPLVLPFNEGGWFWCNQGDSLTLVVTGTSNTIAGILTYVTE